MKLGRLLAAAEKSAGGDPSVAAAQHAGASEYRRMLEPESEDDPRRSWIFFAVVLTAVLPLSTASISSGVPSRRIALARFTLAVEILSRLAALSIVVDGSLDLSTRKPL